MDFCSFNGKRIDVEEKRKSSIEWFFPSLVGLSTRCPTAKTTTNTAGLQQTTRWRIGPQSVVCGAEWHEYGSSWDPTRLSTQLPSPTTTPQYTWSGHLSLLAVASLFYHDPVPGTSGVQKLILSLQRDLNPKNDRSF